MHTGAAQQARRLARRNLKALAGADAIVTNAAGCGSGMREYGLLFKGEPEEAQAAALAARVLDVSVFLADLGLREAPADPGAPIVAAYQDACHLAHAQGVTRPPRRLLESVPGLQLVTVPEWELCCGSAGTYNVERPDIAAQLGERKARNLASTGAQLVATGNIGCLTQVQTHLRALGHDLPVLHTMQVLDRAYSQTLKEHTA
jgi:glycolate oxidase iron-sulfur subunit